MKNTRVRNALLVTAIAVATAACGTSNASNTAPPTCVALFDVSGSTEAEGLRNRYLESFDTVLDACGKEEGAVTGDVIDNNSQTAPCPPVTVDFRIDEKVNDLYDSAERDRIRTEAHDKTAALLACPAHVAGGTDVVGGITSSASALRRGTGPRRLVVFSDMISWGGPAHVAQLTDDQAIQPVIDRTKAAGLLPDLKGVDVYVMSSAVGDSTKLDPLVLRRVETFWRAYFTTTGANLVSYQKTLSFP